MKKRVIHFTIANTGGGITKFVLSLWKHINRSRFQFDFATMSSYLDFADELEREGCKIHYITAYAEDNREQFIKEIKEILSVGYDIVHLHTNWWRGYLIEEIAKEMGVPKIIIHAHNTDVHIKENQSRDEARKLHNEQKQYLNENMATDFLACSRKAAEWLYGDRIASHKVQIIPNAIELNMFEYDKDARANYRKSLGLDGKYVIGHVGRFSYQKNHDFLLEVFGEVAKKNKDARLLLVGTGELQKTMEEKAKLLGVERCVIFTGKRDDVSGIMQAMDIFVFPSRFEGLGIVLIEAQASGLRCIVSDAIPEEALITKNIEILPLEKNIWVKVLMDAMNCAERECEIEEIRKAGYDVEIMTKEMEKIYQA